MLAHLKLALLCAVLAMIVAMSTVEAARQLLDRYDDCRGGCAPCAGRLARVQVVLLAGALVGCACQIWVAGVGACHTQCVPALTWQVVRLAGCHCKR